MYQPEHTLNCLSWRCTKSAEEALPSRRGAEREAERFALEEEASRPLRRAQRAGRDQHAGPIVPALDRFRWRGFGAAPSSRVSP